MSVDWTHLTFAASLCGGLLIGFAAAMLMLLNGRIAGISGILGGLIRSPARGQGWRLAFIAGLIAAPSLYRCFVAAPFIQIDAGWALLIVAGLIVGIGTRYGSGCTSGHGVCGLSRLSPRSLIATVLFMATGFLTVFVVRHLLAG